MPPLGCRTDCIFFYKAADLALADHAGCYIILTQPALCLFPRSGDHLPDVVEINFGDVVGDQHIQNHIHRNAIHRADNPTEIPPPGAERSRIARLAESTVGPLYREPGLKSALPT